MVNLSLLAKWRWQFLQDTSVLWCDLLKHKYRAFQDELYAEYMNGWLVWWKYIMNIDLNGYASGVWFINNVRRKARDGASTLSWDNQWYEDQSLKQRFPCLFQVANDRLCSVRDMGRMIDGSWCWRRPMFVWEQVDVVDSWSWIVDGSNNFSVASTFKVLEQQPPQLSRCQSSNH